MNNAQRSESGENDDEALSDNENKEVGNKKERNNKNDPKSDKKIEPRKKHKAKDDEQEYKCRFCDKIFSQAQALGGHMNKHRAEKEDEKYRNAEDLLVKTHRNMGWLPYQPPRYDPYLQQPVFFGQRETYYAQEDPDMDAHHPQLPHRHFGSNQLLQNPYQNLQAGHAQGIPQQGEFATQAHQARQGEQAQQVGQNDQVQNAGQDEPVQDARYIVQVQQERQGAQLQHLEQGVQAQQEGQQEGQQQHLELGVQAQQAYGGVQTPNVGPTAQAQHLLNPLTSTPSYID